MGLYTEMLWPFMGWMLIFAIVLSVVMVLINKFLMYNGPEDEEMWEEDEEHFNMFNAEERIKKLEEV